MSDLPQKTRVYSTHLFNSERWNNIEFRDDDIIVSTAMKSGTNWMIRIVGMFVHQDPYRTDAQMMHAPWPDATFLGTEEDAVKVAESVAHQRFMKSHVPLDGHRYDPRVKHINVVRDIRDNFMSVQNHWVGITDELYQKFHAYWGTPFPRQADVGDIHERWRRWMTEGSNKFVSDGYPFQSAFNYAESYWNYRHIPNILLVHFNDLKADLEGEMRRIARFLNKEIPDSDWPAYVEAATFKTMKKDMSTLKPEIEQLSNYGTKGFMHSGKNKRWMDVLTEDDLALYEARASTLDTELRNWLENGRLLSGDIQDW